MFIEAVTPPLLTVLRTLQQHPSFSDFALGGGTSLALRFGHRRSVDIDLFSVHTFNTEELLNECKFLFKEVNILNRTVGSLCLQINDIQVDILHHAYPLLSQVDIIDGLRLVALNDLAAMKINAVTNRGSKKDFVDLLLLHKNQVPLLTALSLFEKKYGASGRFLAVRSLLFFDDANEEPDPVFLNDWTWNSVKTQISTIAKKLV